MPRRSVAGFAFAPATALITVDQPNVAGIVHHDGQSPLEPPVQFLDRGVDHPHSTGGTPTRLGSLPPKVVKRTAGFRARSSRLLGGWRGGMPNKYRTIPRGSLAEQAARSGRPEYAEGDGIAALATPVLWKGRLAKVIVVAVPWEHRRALEPQLGRQRQPHSRNGFRAVTAAP